MTNDTKYEIGKVLQKRPVRAAEKHCSGDEAGNDYLRSKRDAVMMIRDSGSRKYMYDRSKTVFECSVPFIPGLEE